MSRTHRQLPSATTDRASARGDVAALTHALAAQQLSLACYAHVIGSPSIAAAGAGTGRALARLRDQEHAHVLATSAALRRRGGTVPAPPPDVAALDRALAHHHIGGRPGQLQGPHDALGLLLAVERVAIGGAYTALTTVHEPAVSLLLAQTMASDAQHAAIVHELSHPGDIAHAIAYGIVQGFS